MALGEFPRLTPIIVSCSSRHYADEAAQLNTEVFAVTDLGDAHQLAYRVQESDVSVQLKSIYAVRKAKPGGHTGIWVGFPWYVLSTSPRLSVPMSSCTGPPSMTISVMTKSAAR